MRISFSAASAAKPVTPPTIALPDSLSPGERKVLEADLKKGNIRGVERYLKKHAEGTIAKMTHAIG